MPSSTRSKKKILTNETSLINTNKENTKVNKPKNLNKKVSMTRSTPANTNSNTSSSKLSNGTIVSAPKFKSNANKQRVQRRQPHQQASPSLTSIINNIPSPNFSSSTYSLRSNGHHMNSNLSAELQLPDTTVTNNKRGSSNIANASNNLNGNSKISDASTLDLDTTTTDENADTHQHDNKEKKRKNISLKKPKIKSFNQQQNSFLPSYSIFGHDHNNFIGQPFMYTSPFFPNHNNYFINNTHQILPTKNKNRKRGRPTKLTMTNSNSSNTQNSTNNPQILPTNRQENGFSLNTVSKFKKGIEKNSQNTNQNLVSLPSSVKDRLVEIESLGGQPSMARDSQCRYCGARYASAFSRSPQGPRRLCTSHYVKVFQHKSLDLSKQAAIEPSKAINPSENTELAYLDRVLTKLRQNQVKIKNKKKKINVVQKSKIGSNATTRKVKGNRNVNYSRTRLRSKISTR